MTATITAPASTPNPVAGRRSAGFATTALEIAKRTIKQFFRNPQILMMGTIQGALFLFMFRYVFGGAINPRSQVPYVDWLVPGFLTTVILWTGMSAASGVAEDGNSGLYDRLRSLPVPRSAVMVGRSLADATLVGWGVFTTAIIGYLVGFRSHGSIAAVVAAYALIIVAGWAFGWIFIFMGLVSKSAQAAQGLSMLVVPFSFVSSANVPIKSMPGWMQPFAANQPVTVIINAVRSLMLGGTDVVGIDHSTGYWVVLALIWSAAIAVVFCALCTGKFAKQR